MAVRVIELARRGAGLTQLDLANRLRGAGCPVTQSIISCWERGLRKPGANECAALIRLLEIDEVYHDRLQEEVYL